MAQDYIITHTHTDIHARIHTCMHIVGSTFFLCVLSVDEQLHNSAIRRLVNGLRLILFVKSLKGLTAYMALYRVP